MHYNELNTKTTKTNNNFNKFSVLVKNYPQILFYFVMSLVTEYFEKRIKKISGVYLVLLKLIKTLSK